jgi:hypothetical protein
MRDVLRLRRCTIERSAAREEALENDLGAIAVTSLDKGVELDALVKLRPFPIASANCWAVSRR